MTQGSITELLTALGVDETRIRVLSEFLDKTTPKPSEEQKIGRQRRTLRRVQEVLEKHQAMQEENLFLRDRLDTLAAALGACMECWGEYNACPECGGEGKPGFYRPDPAAFSAFVLPAVRAAQQLHRRRAARTEGATAAAAPSQAESVTQPPK